jgi:PAS domain S-box-containing protein
MVLNEKGETTYASDSLYRIMGYKAEEVLGIPSSEFIYPEDVPIIEGNLKHVLKAPGKPSTITYRRVKKDGTTIWCEGTANNLLHEPAVRGIVVNFRDVTDRKNIEIALRNSEYKYRSLFENSADAVIVIDEHWKLIYASESLYNILGYTPSELLGTVPDRFIHPDDLPAVHSQRKVSLASPGKAIPITNPSAHRRVKKDGTTIWSEGTITNLLEEPAIKGLVINFRDITDRKASEDALRQSNEELKKSNTELDRFVYSVSHDLRAPLTSMLGIISIAKDETGDENMLSYMGMLQESITKLDGFIHDILDYSRNARIDIKRQQINFKALLNDITDNLRFMNPEVPVEIRMQIDETATYYSDKGRISVILNNLISNAIRYYNTEAEKPFVDIAIKPSGGNILLTVKDNGIGINKDKQGRIFEMFYRVSQRSTGSGLGLYIVKETVEKLNGDIKLVSEPSKGSCFSILIPNL